LEDDRLVLVIRRRDRVELLVHAAATEVETRGEGNGRNDRDRDAAVNEGTWAHSMRFAVVTRK
jgi:hypothetical protein